MTKKTIFNKFIDKASLKQDVFHKGQETLQSFRLAGNQLLKEYKSIDDPRVKEIPVQINNVGEYELRVRFGGDVALFIMHSNVFTFPENHSIYTVPYIKEDPNRAYFTVISVYNFLNDSFKYNRLNDFGHLVERIFINKDMHYFIESQELQNRAFPLLSQSVFDQEEANRIIKEVVNYIVEFDLEVPDMSYVEHIQLNNVVELNKQLSTSKRLGFKFKNEIES